MKLLILGALSLFCASVYADPRIYNYVYDKEFVYPIYTMKGEAFILQLEADEHFKGEVAAIGLGDSGAWSTAVRGNSVIMKPVGEKPNTNLLIVSSKRTYAFEIVSSSHKHRPTYVVRFRYPDSEVVNKARSDAMVNNQRQQANLMIKMQADKAKFLDTATGRARPVFNSHYSWIGNRSMINPKMASPLKPTAAWDDGRFTHLLYDSSISMPNFYKLTSDGTEALMNTHTDAKEPNVVILQEVVPKVIVRLGKDVMEITNDSYIVPVFNSTGTGDFDSLRVINKGDSNE